MKIDLSKNGLSDITVVSIGKLIAKNESLTHLSIIFSKRYNVKKYLKECRKLGKNKNLYLSIRTVIDELEYEYVD